MAFNAYLKIDGVDGESTGKGFEKFIELQSFNFGAQMPHTMSGAGGFSAGRPDVSAFSVSKLTDVASPILFSACCSGKHFLKAWVVVNKSSGQGADLTYLKYDFKNVFIDSIQMSGTGGGGGLPTSEALAFSFGYVEISYTPQTEKGAAGSPVRASYDVQKGVV